MALNSSSLHNRENLPISRESIARVIQKLPDDDDDIFSSLPSRSGCSKKNIHLFRDPTISFKQKLSSKWEIISKKVFTFNEKEFTVQGRNTAERIEVVVWNNHSDEFGTLDWFDEEHLNQKIVQYIESAGCFTQILIEFHCIPMENMDVLEELSKFTRNVLICFEF